MPGHFGILLRRLRIAANLSQEALAEEARISSGAVSAYERGLRAAPHPESVARLATALGLVGTGRDEFEAAARRKSRARSLVSDDRARTSAQGNLPVETTSFVGRDLETGEITELLRRHRVVTITGAGGVGKTRIALRVVSHFRPIHRDGEWVVDLGSIADTALVATKISATLALSPTVTQPTTADLIERLAERELLIVFDNCEHVVDTIGGLAAAIAKVCRNITILATSRERLRICGEAVYHLATLAVPARNPQSASEAKQYPAIELFLERAGSADRHFVLTDTRAALVADICRRLSGLPLAIELAAARLPALGLGDLSNVIASSYSALSKGPRDVPARQRTLDATIDWSYNLLGGDERLPLQRISIFRGGCTLSAAEAICTDTFLSSSVVAETLASLVDKSLAVVDDQGTLTRYTSFESTRDYASRKLRETGDQTALYRRYAEWWAAFADEAENFLFEKPARDWVSSVYPELGNIDRAVEWATGPDGDDVLAARIIGSLPLWAHLKRFMQRNSVEVPPPIVTTTWTVG